MATTSGSSSYQTLQTQSSSTTVTSVATTETPLTNNPHISPTLRTMTIPTQIFPPSLIQNQPISTTNNETLNTNITNFTNQKNACFKNTNNTSETSLVETTISPFSNLHRSFDSNKTLMASTTSTSITNQRSSATASLLFVRPANHSNTLHVVQYNSTVKLTTESTTITITSEHTHLNSISILYSIKCWSLVPVSNSFYININIFNFDRFAYRQFVSY